jgi:hypothetical protein
MGEVRVSPEDYESSSKFGHDPLTEALWVCSMVSGQDDEAGEADGPVGWNAIFHFENAKDVKLFDEHPDSSEISPIVTVPRGSYILEQGSSGAVYSTRYEYKSREVESIWQDILDGAYPEDEEEML